MKRPWAKLSGACFIGMFVVAIVASSSGGFTEENKWCFIASIVLVYASIGFFIAHLVSTREERQKLRAERREKIRREVAEKREQCRAEVERLETFYTPRAVSAVYVGDTEKMALKRAFTAALFGPVGMVVGTYRTLKPKKVAFEVTYENGRTAIETVKVGSDRYIQLMCLAGEGW